MAKKLNNLTNLSQIQLYFSLSISSLYLRMVPALAALTFRTPLKSTLKLSAKKPLKFDGNMRAWVPTLSPIPLSSANWRILGLVNLLSGRGFRNWYGRVSIFRGFGNSIPKSKPNRINLAALSPVGSFSCCRIFPVWYGVLFWKATLWTVLVSCSLLMGAPYLVSTLIHRCYPLKLNLLNYCSEDKFSLLLDIYNYLHLLNKVIAQTNLITRWIPFLTSVVNSPFYCISLLILRFISCFVFIMEKSFKQTLLTKADQAKISEEQNTCPGKKNKSLSLDDTTTLVGNNTMGVKNKLNLEKGDSSKTRAMPNASAFLAELSKFKNSFSKNQDKHIDFNKKVHSNMVNWNEKQLVMLYYKIFSWFIAVQGFLIKSENVHLNPDRINHRWRSEPIQPSTQGMTVNQTRAAFVEKIHLKRSLYPVICGPMIIKNTINVILIIT